MNFVRFIMPRTWVGVLLFLVLIFASAGSALAADPSIKVNPQNVSLGKIGDEATVQIQVTDVANLYGTDFTLKFDPAVVEVKDAFDTNPGVQIQLGEIFSGSEQTLSAMNKVDNSKGVIRFAHIFLGKTNGFTGTGNVAKITFIAKKNNSSAVLNLFDVDLVDADTKPISAKVWSGSLVVGEGANPEGPPVGETNPGPTVPQPGTGGTGNHTGGERLERGNLSKALKFTDVLAGWAKTQIENLAERGIISGYPDGTFRPLANVTRVEFICMVAKAFNLQNGDPGTILFKDQASVPAWAKSAVASAAQQEIIKGDNKNNIRANNAITRAELAVIIVRALGLENETKTFAKEQLKFRDTELIPPWALNYVGVAYKYNIIAGFPDGNFKANDLANREQVAVMISRMIPLMKK